MAEPVRYERRGAAAVLTIDRPERRNAVDGPTAEALARGYEEFAADDGARVLVLHGAGGVAFCAGADLKAIETFGPRLADPRGPLGFTRLTPPKPAIAAIDGWCLAGGLELALWCDLRVAGEGSTLGFPERRWGVPLIDGGTQRLPRIVGLGRALDIILTGRMVPAREALEIGLVTELCPAGTRSGARSPMRRRSRRSRSRPCSPTGAPRSRARAPAGRRPGARGAGRPRGVRRRRARRGALRRGRGPRRQRRRRLTEHWPRDAAG